MSNSDGTPKKFEIKIGGYYVGGDGKDYLTRLVTDVGAIDGLPVFHWESYFTRTGKSTGDRMCCSLKHLRRWAAREATREEIARIEGGWADDKQ